MAFAIGEPFSDDYLRAAARGARAPGRGSPRAELAQGRPRPRPAVPRRDRRRGHVGARRRAPAATSRRRRRDHREERRRRRHLVREPLSRLAASTCPTTSTATRSRNATTGRSSSAPQAMLLDYFRALRRRPRPHRAHPLRHRGRERGVPRRHGDWTLTVRNPDGSRRDARRQRARERGRPAQPAEPARHRGPRRRSRARRSTRRSGTTTVDLARQAGRGDRHRRERRSSSSRNRRRRRRAARVPAHAQLVHADAAVLRDDARRDAVAARERAVLQPVVPLLALLAAGRRLRCPRRGSTPTGHATTAR